MITVIGAANVDVQALVTEKLIKHDSSPGRIAMSAGGVGRNIAHNLRLLGEKVRFITALSEDANSQILRSNLTKLDIDFSLSLTLSTARTSSYVCLLDETGSLYGAVNDMGILELLTPQHLEKVLSVLRKDDLVIADTNITADSLAAIKNAVLSAGARLVIDTVSEAKCSRCSSLLEGVFAIKPNMAEASLLTGIPVTQPRQASEAAEIFHSRGIRYVCISLGKNGLLYSGDGQRGIVGVADLPVVNVSGAGDAMTAGLVFALNRGKSIQESALFAQACASLTCASEKTTSDELCFTKVAELSQTLNQHPGEPQ